MLLPFSDDTSGAVTLELPMAKIATAFLKATSAMPLPVRFPNAHVDEPPEKILTANYLAFATLHRADVVTYFTYRR